MTEPFFITAAELATLSASNWPSQFLTHKHLILSSPATLTFNSPGATGFGVKRAALSMPESIMLLFSPSCCSRNTSAIGGPMSDYGRRTFYLPLNDTDIVTGRYTTKILQASVELAHDYAPKVLLLCSTCVDALLATDMDRLCKKVEDQTGIPTLSTTMYALTREGHVPPMVGIQKTLYSLLPTTTKQSNIVNILGFFSHLNDHCELYVLLRQIGIEQINELGRMQTFFEYQQMAKANFNIVLNPEARLAAKDLAKRIAMPFIELTRTYQVEKIKKQYTLLGQILKVNFDQTPFFAQAQASQNAFRKKHPKIRVAIGECCNANVLDLAIALARTGIEVREIFCDPSPSLLLSVRILAELLPNLRIYSNLSPSMLAYTSKNDVDVSIGFDAKYYHPEIPATEWNDTIQPFGYQAVHDLFQALEQCV